MCPHTHLVVTLSTAVFLLFINNPVARISAHVTKHVPYQLDKNTYIIITVGMCLHLWTRTLLKIMSLIYLPYICLCILSTDSFRTFRSIDWVKVFTYFYRPSIILAWLVPWTNRSLFWVCCTRFESLLGRMYLKTLSVSRCIGICILKHEINLFVDTRNVVYDEQWTNSTTTTHVFCSQKTCVLRLSFLVCYWNTIDWSTHNLRPQ